MGSALPPAKLRLNKIDSYEGANQYLVEQYLEEHRRRFAVEPAFAEITTRKRRSKEGLIERLQGSI